MKNIKIMGVVSQRGESVPAPGPDPVTYTFNSFSNITTNTFRDTSITSTQIDNIVSALDSGHVKTFTFVTDYVDVDLIANYETQTVGDANGTQYSWGIYTTSVNFTIYADDAFGSEIFSNNNNLDVFMSEDWGTMVSGIQIVIE